LQSQWRLGRERILERRQVDQPHAIPVEIDCVLGYGKSDGRLSNAAGTTMDTMRMSSTPAR